MLPPSREPAYERRRPALRYRNSTADEVSPTHDGSPLPTPISKAPRTPDLRALIRRYPSVENYVTFHVRKQGFRPFRPFRLPRPVTGASGGSGGDGPEDRRPPVLLPWRCRCSGRACPAKTATVWRRQPTQLIDKPQYHPPKTATVRRFRPPRLCYACCCRRADRRKRFHRRCGQGPGHGRALCTPFHTYGLAFLAVGLRLPVGQAIRLPGPQANGLRHRRPEYVTELLK